MNLESSTDGDARTIERDDALAAMLEIEMSMIEATRQMIELNKCLPTLSAGARPRARARLEELSDIITAYVEQIRYLQDRFEAGE
jgi:hypothetical protein